MAKFLHRSPKRLAGKYCATTARLLLSTVSFAAVPAGSVWAQSVTWNGGTGDWSVGANWNGGVAPGAGNDVFISDNGTAKISSGVAAGTLFLGVLGGTPGNLTIDAGGSLTLSGALDVGSVGGGASLLDINGGALSQTDGTTWIRESGTLMLRGGGSINVLGNSNDGVLGLDGGTLIIGDGGGSIFASSIWSLVSSPGQVIFDNTGNSSFSTLITGVVKLTHKGSGTTILSGANTYTGGTTLNAGVLSVSQNANLGGVSGTLTFNGGTLQTTAGFSMNRATTIGAGGGTFDISTGTLTQAGEISGAGSLIKTGTGTLTLTGNSSAFGGTTTVSDGALRLEGLLGGNKEAKGTGVIEAAIANAFNGGSHTFQQSSRLDASVAGSISGGTFRFFQSGTLNASATGAVSGSDIILTNVANLNANARHAVSNSTVNLDSNARVTLGANDALTADTHFTFTRVAIDPNIGGTFDLNGYSTELGSISSGYSVGHGLGLITNDGSSDSVLTLSDAAASTTFSGVIQDGSGTLGLTLAAGALTLDNAANTYTGGTTILGGTLTAGRAGAFVDNTAYVVNGGTLDLNGFDLTMSSLSGVGGTVAIGAANLTANQAANTSFAGVLSGTGAFTKSGSGTLTLTGNSSAFAGATTVGSGGALVVGVGGSGALGGAVTIGSGSRLGGTGTIGSAGSTLTIAAGGAHAPGNSIGVQTISGNYANHGTLTIEATPTAADRIVVAGSVDITGASLDLILSPADASSWGVFNGPFTIIDKQSAGAVAGTFGSVTKNLLFLDTVLDYAGGDGNDVTLQLERNNVTFAAVGQTRNQIAAGTAAETLGNGSAVWRTIALTNDPDLVRLGFDALSGEIHASAKNVMIEDSRFLRNATNDRLRAAFGGVGASNGNVVTYVDGKPVPVAATTDGLAVWGQGFGAWGNINGDGNAASVSHSSGGFFAGIDAPVFDTWRFGAVTGYSRSSFDVKDRFSTGSSDNYHLGLYGGTQWGDLAFRTGAAYTWHDITTNRPVSFAGFGDSLKGGYNAGTAQVYGEFGYKVQVGSVAFEPFANLAYVNLNTSGFAERGGAAAISSASSSMDATFTTLGLRGSATFDVNGASLTAKGMIGWRHAFGDTVPLSGMQFASGGAPFTIAGVPIARDAAVIEAGLDYAISPSATLGIAYGGQFGSGVTDQSVKANLSVKF